MTTTRRTLLQLAGGVTAGVACSPVPWGLLRDSAMWTQNGPWIPKLPHGEITVQATHCTLCPAACPVSVRCVGKMPVGIWPKGEPICPAGFVGHHLAAHPARLRQTLYRGKPAQLAGEVKQQIAAGRVAVLDLAPGRTASFAMRERISQLPESLYIVPPVIEGGTAEAIARLASEPVDLALDLERTRTLISIGTPVLDGWAAPKRTVDRKFRLVQVESQRSHTADLADEWIRIEPGGELALLLGLAEVISLRNAAELAGVPLSHLHHLRAELQNPGTAVLADGDPANGPYPDAIRQAAAALNIRIGVVGTPGGFISRNIPPLPPDWNLAPITELSRIENASIGVLLIDDPAPGTALPWALVQQKLSADAIVIACTWSAAGAARHAQWQIPTPVYLEAESDAPPAVDSAGTSLRTSQAMMTPPEGALTALALLGGDLAAALKARSEAELATAKPRKLNYEEPHLFAEAVQKRLTPRVPGWRQAAVSPLLEKLWRESDLKQTPGAWKEVQA